MHHFKPFTVSLTLTLLALTPTIGAGAPMMSRRSTPMERAMVATNCAVATRQRCDAASHELIGKLYFVSH